jgi:hypothetical protein
MLVQDLTGSTRLYRSFVLAMLLLIGGAISAQAFHFHPPSEPVGSTHCTLCEVGEAPLVLLMVSAIPPTHSIQAVEIATSVATLQFVDGLNLSVRAPPLSN